MILVTGATGNVGGQVVRALCARGEMVRAAARTAERLDVPSDVETARVDLDHPDTLDPALDAIHAVFLLGGFATMPELLSRMRAAGVDHVVLLTSRCVIGGRPDNAITGMWLQSEATLRNGGIAWTILRPSGFQSNVLRWLPQRRRGDTVRAPGPTCRSR